MSTKEDKFLEQLRSIFKVEAQEHVQVIAAGLLELEKTPSTEAKNQNVEVVFRAAHSLKGAARAVDFTEIEMLCQSLEDVFACWKRHTSEPSPDALDALHRTLDAITSTLAAPGSIPQAALSLLRQALRGFATASSAAFEEPAVAVPSAPVIPPTKTELVEMALPVETEKAAVQETVRVAVSKLEARLLEAEEMLTAKLTASQRVADLRELCSHFDAWRNACVEIEPEVRQLRQQTGQGASPTEQHRAAGMIRILDFFDWNLDHVKAVEGKAAALERTAQQDHYAVGKLVDDLLEESKKMLLLPFSAIAASFPKLVRDLCREQGKEVDLVVLGEDIEIDKRILEEIKDPLIHLLRNSVDHGIETPSLRGHLGKAARATITLAVSQMSGNKVEISVSDDGAGIDTVKVKEAAVKHGRLSAPEALQLDDAEAQALIFQTDVSTSAMITRLSGRGLGLAIVREKAEKLGGTVMVESQAQRGTCFRMVLPSMLATFRGILVEAQERLFVVPTFHVERVARVQTDDVQTVEGRETIVLGGRAIALAQLADVLELPRAKSNRQQPASMPVIILGTADQRVAFSVDAVVDEQEVLVKHLGKPLSRVRNIAGATVLGSGQVVPILNVADLLKSVRKTGGAARRAAAGITPLKLKTILVAEDSITSRMLIKGILESAGYTVKTAVDGMDAFTLLRAEKFDLLVSDVEMPRLNGFDLTQRVRADKKLAELPVILVTALESREDRERGIDVGAHAYLVKSNFDQSDLLEVVRRLV